KISVPSIVLEFAERAGCEWLYLADFNRALMARMTLSRVRCGILQGDGEFYVDIADLELVAFRKWRYAEATLDLESAGVAPAPTKQRQPGPCELPGISDLRR